MNSLILVIDRIESGIAVCEPLDQGETREFEIALLPKGAKEGDVLIYDGKRLIFDEDSTAARTNKIQSMLDVIFKKK
ncbi:MAG: DUF3006 domain-containing protein [Defluviitaleaceae bacterium]|nr:DUF3006 domain-containing protein [Defluviitaleaceae bacterium]